MANCSVFFLTGLMIFDLVYQAIKYPARNTSEKRAHDKVLARLRHTGGDQEPGWDKI